MDVDPAVISFNVILGVLLVDILLSGDNAIVIAMVCRSLPKSSQFRVMWMGIAGAFVARLLMTGVATLAMQLPFIKLIGGLLLLKISVGLIVDNVRSGPSHATPDIAAPPGSVFAAAKTIIVADLVMSLDNVLALSAVTNNNFEMLVLGLVLSIPILMFGSIYITKLLDMFPILLWAGAATLAGVSGGLLIDDPLFDGFFSADTSLSHFVVPLLAAVGVVQVSRIILRNGDAMRGVPVPPSLFAILRGEAPAAQAAPVADVASAEHVATVAHVAAASKAVVLTSAVHQSAVVPVATAIQSVPVEDKLAVADPHVSRDYRVITALGLFMLLVGWVVYAMVNTEPPVVPERFVAYRCQSPALVVLYRANTGEIRFSTTKGMVQARLLDGHIAWDDENMLVVQTLNLQPPDQVLTTRDDQLVLNGGAFDHVACTAAH